VKKKFRTLLDFFILHHRKRISQQLYRTHPHNSAELTAHNKLGLTFGTQQL
jgi:hypothetical protein